MMWLVHEVKRWPLWKKSIYALGFSNFFVLGCFRCSGPSMLPTIEDSGAFVLVDYFSHKVLRRSFNKGDIVVALSPGYLYRPVCKRVCAMEGEEVHYEHPVNKTKERTVIPEGHVWLLGDNPADSTDSRHYGPVQRGRLRGRVFWKLWPFGGF